MLGLAAIGSVGGCYREGAAPLVNRADPLVQHDDGAACSRVDDLHHPPVDANPSGRLRTHTHGPLSGPSRRTWAGPAVPDYVPTTQGSLELFIADDADDGILALYRDPYNVGSCTLGGNKNCAYEARFFDDRGETAWSVRLDQLVSRPDHLEVQDIRLAGGVLYFNEACQSYAAGADGRCSSLVAVDPRARRVLWRTEPLVSNGRFRIRGCYIIAGYGFTAEPDHLHVIQRATGRVVQRVPVSSAPEELTLVGPERLDVVLYSGVTRRYRLDGFEGGRGALVSLDPPEPMYGGAGYGGYGYGGYGYGGSGYGGMYGGGGYGAPIKQPIRP